MDFRLVQLLNAEPPSICSWLFSAKFTVSRFVQPQNALVVSLVTPAPTLTVVMRARLACQGMLASP